MNHPQSIPAKKMKNSILNYFPKKPTDSNSEAKGASQTGEKVQKRINITSKKNGIGKGKGNNGRDPLKERKNDVFKDKVKEGPSKSHMQQCDEGQSHSFNFRYKFKKHAVACDTSKTVLDALNTNKIFKKIKKENMEKEIVIKRSSGEVPRAAVKTDFPCCLIEKDELLDITFIKNTGNDTKKPKPERLSFSNESGKFVIFYIKTKGGDKVKRLLKNHELRKEVEDVCVYALKEEKLRKALRRDGRFINDIFKKQCALRELGSEIDHLMSNTVEHLDQKHFKIIVISDKNEPESQEDFLSDDVSPEMNEASAADLKENVDPNQHPVNTEQEETQKRNTMKSTNTSANSFKILPDSEEILGILRSQFKGLMETLKQRENLKNKTQVQKFFRAEYDKSVQSFSEVYKIKELMRLSDSVCQIRVEGFAKGTGFLLFGQFILTNAHVVREFLESPDKLSSTKSLEAAFDFNRLDSKVKLVRVKKQIAAYCNVTANNRRLDFALLELDAGDEITGRPELLRRFSPGPPPSGGICIVGHPEGGIKRMDPCFIIEKNNLQEAADKHISENFDFIHVITQRSFEEKWDIYENQMNYHSCFFHGSSGSPVFDEHCYLIGVHTGGYVYKGDRGKTRSVVEYAYSMQSILEMIKAQARIRGSHDIVNILEAYSNKSYEYGTADQENQTDCEMEVSD